MKEHIQNIVADARDALVKQHGGNGQPIDGACHKNAVFLCDYFLEHTEYQPYLRWGVINYHGTEYDTLREAEDDDAVHFWVELQPEDTWIHADVFTMKSHPDGLRRGDLFASYGLPETYQQLDDTLFEYDPSVINADDIVSYMDYQLLTSVIDPIR